MSRPVDPRCSTPSPDSWACSMRCRSSGLCASRASCAALGVHRAFVRKTPGRAADAFPEEWYRDERAASVEAMRKVAADSKDPDIESSINVLVGIN